MLVEILGIFRWNSKMLIILIIHIYNVIFLLW